MVVGGCDMESPRLHQEETKLLPHQGNILEGRGRLSIFAIPLHILFLH